MDDISKIENMEYNESGDYYICENNKKLIASKIIKRKSKTGSESEKTVYTCEDCSNCLYKSKCIKVNNSKPPLEQRVKNLETLKVFNKLRKEDLERIVSQEGCELRINRSIQVEGSFADIKQNMEFNRFLCKGKQKVFC